MGLHCSPRRWPDDLCEGKAPMDRAASPLLTGPFAPKGGMYWGVVACPVARPQGHLSGLRALTLGPTSSVIPSGGT